MLSSWYQMFLLLRPWRGNVTGNKATSADLKLWIWGSWIFSLKRVGEGRTLCFLFSLFPCKVLPVLPYAEVFTQLSLGSVLVRRGYVVLGGSLSRPSCLPFCHSWRDSLCLWLNPFLVSLLYCGTTASRLLIISCADFTAPNSHGFCSLWMHHLLFQAQLSDTTGLAAHSACKQSASLLPFSPFSFSLFFPCIGQIFALNTTILSTLQCLWPSLHFWNTCQK